MSRHPALLLAVAALLALPGAASAHATLEGTQPAGGARLAHAPRTVVFRFSEDVTVGLGAVRVYDARGRQVQRGQAFQPPRHADEVGIALPGSLAAGGYTATYRVISADSHPVEGGLTFDVGGGAAAARGVDGLLRGQEAGPVTTTAFAAIRAAEYAAIALGLGVVVFLAWCWLPALRDRATAGEDWRRASEAFASRTRLLLGLAAGAGFVAALAALCAQGAVAGGTTLWAAIRPRVVDEVLATRFGVVWALGALGWIVILGRVTATPRPVPALRVATLGSDGLALPGVRGLAVLGLPLVALAALPMLTGHAAVQPPVWLLAPANVLHVLAMSAWLGGIAVLVIGLRAATTRLDIEDRAGLLAAVLVRFSALAGVAVALLAATGIAQAIVEVRTPAHLLDTAFGRAVLIKLVALVAIVACGALHRRRLLPALAAAVTAGGSSGQAGVLVRRVLRLELLVGVTALAVSGALAGYAPSTTAAQGPWSGSAVLGPARLEASVEPARVGVNTVHLYAFARRTGRQETRLMDLQVTATLPKRGIGPLPLTARVAGPGHWQLDRAALSPAGTWTLTVTGRTSAFDEDVVHLTVPIH